MERLEHILPPFWRDEIRRYIRDDCPHHDVQGFVVGDSPETAVLLAKTPTVVAGKPFFTAVFEELGCTVEWLVEEGAILSAVPMKIANVRGPCRSLLLGERTALNIIARASGIASAAHELVSIAKCAGWHGEIAGEAFRQHWRGCQTVAVLQFALLAGDFYHGYAGTRKVTPGFRMVEKYALLVGGASTHRMDLSQMVMLKDNHIWAAGSITAAVKDARKVGGFSIKIEVETRGLEEALEAAAAGADVIMLDNYAPAALIVDAIKLKAAFPRVVVEASGGITKTTLSSFFSPAVDVVSLGSLTQGYSCADYSLKIYKGSGITSVDKAVSAGVA